MDGLKITIRQVIHRGVLLLSLVFFSFLLTIPAQAEPMTITQVDQSQSDQYAVSFVRDKNYACTQCHKDEHDTLKGEHANAVNEKTGRNVGCIDCHNTISPQHRNGAPHVVKFKSGQVMAGRDKPAQDPTWVQKQNAQCIDCHQGQTLREANWTHDVHAMSLTCASCHKIHPQHDPMQGIDRKSRIKMCVDCHSDMTAIKQEDN